ncbi:uncharacterized protein LOC108908457 [Anoplophora glabripennis]|uniref:uncharacterized protein LOC108908457 n=1 Tax=Anoplophora glabripennis TaxID=217634 RepID=UPI00087509D2|nr:uncharacterized protein LOC108908457 [Anoplophora glabripennis]
MELEAVNLSQICRTCKCVAPQMRSLFEGYENAHQSPRIDEMLMACTSVQVMLGDGLPAQMCQMCVEQLKNAFLFKRQSEKIDASLREYAKNVKVNEIKQELQNSDFMESLNTLNNLLNEQSSSKVNNADTSMPSIAPKIETDYIQFLDNNQMLLTCRECAKIFTTLEGLRCHKRIHTGEMYKCKQCDKAYTRLNHLQRHEQSHTRRKVHVCRICSKTLTRMEHLKRHLVTHLREKPFSCNTCNRGFNRIEHLQNHTPRCKGDIVYPCNICNKAFNRVDSLEVHKTMHDNQQPELPTIENLDNIEDHYYQIDQDADAVFSDHSDIDDCFEPQVEVTESLDDDHIKEVAEMGLPDEESNASEASVAGGDKDNDIDSSLDKTVENIENEEGEDNKDVKVEDSLEEVENFPVDDDNIADVVNDVGEDSCDSADSEYLPKKLVSPKIKRGRGRPRKNPDAPPRPRVKVPGRGRGRPPTKGVKKEEKDEEYGEFPCPACQEMFNTMSSLDKHARIKHEGLKVHKCNVCKKEFSRANHLKRHVTSHSSVKPFRCHVCTKSFNRRDHLNQHQKLHERSNDFECDICQKTFNRADLLAKHRASKHGIGEKIMGEKKYECPLCHKSFTTEKYRDVHVNGHNGQKEYQCRVCEKTFLSKSHLTEHMKFHNEHAKKFLCSECGQRFIRNDYLVIHMRRHRGEKPFKCKYCGKGFPRTTDLTVHERYHTGEKTHLCTICGRGFGRAYNLTVHMRTHTGEKPYQCTYCDAAFAQGNDLKAHIRRHTGERFQCELCSDSFLMGYLLTQHKRTVHGLNVVSNIRRLQPVHKQENPDEPPPITIPLPKPVVPENIMFNAMHVNAMHANTLHAQLTVAQFHLIGLGCDENKWSNSQTSPPVAKADEMELETLNLTQICRTCKCVAPQMRSLFEGYENLQQSPRIDEMLMACTSVQVICGDGLPAQICQVCVEQLENAFLFKRQAERIDASLKEYAKNVKVNEIKEELQNSDFMARNDLSESLNTLSNLLNEQVKETDQEPSVSPIPKIETDYIQFLDNDQMLLTCRECSKIFSTIKGLRWHKRVHTGNLYKCGKCDKQYTRLNHLQRHEESHTRKKVHVCKICSKTLVRMEHLKRHLVTHLKEKPFSCTTCNRVFSRVEHLHNHTPRCKRDIVYPCDTCNKAFNREDSLEVHKKMHDNQPKLPTIENLDNIEEHYYQVDQDVEAVFSDYSDVDDCFEPQVEVTEGLEDDHIKEVVETGLNDDESNASEASMGGGNDNDNDNSVEKVTECLENEEVDDKKDVKVEDALEMKDDIIEVEDNAIDIERDAGENSGDTTDSEYLPKKSLSPKIKRGRGRPRKNPLKPLKIKVPGRGRGRPPVKIKKEEKDEEYGEFPCPACQEIFNTMSALDKHARIKHEGLKVYKCGVCKKEFSRANHLKRHATTHSTVKPFRCLVCTKSFNRRDHLNQHQKLHDKSNAFECDICHRTFSQSDHLARHKASKHGFRDKIMGEKKYECPLCLKRFTTEKYRDIHVNGHNGHKEYHCKVCEKLFLSKSHLTEHMKFHNEHSKKFLCSECGQRFIRNDYLVIHMRRHRGEKPFKCKYCGKGFPRTTDLTVHERYHTGEKTHLCTVCGRGFGRAYNLTVHMRTHTGEKPYQCTYCDAAFAQGNDLKAHIRRHTGERFRCDLCSDSFLMGYMLTQHKRTVHGLNVISNIRRLQPVHKQENFDEPPPITIPLPKPVVPDNMVFNAMHSDSLHAQLAVAQFHLTRE